MKIRATIRLRNERIISAREAKGWSQVEAAAACGVSVRLLGQLERLNFPSTYRIEDALLIADTLGIERVEDVLPEDMVGWRGKTAFQYVEEVSVDRLLEYQETQERHYLLSSPLEDASKSEDVERLRLMVERCPSLTDQERDVIKMRYGLWANDDADNDPPITLEAVAKRLGVSRERTRQIEAKAIGRLQLYAGNSSFMGDIAKEMAI